MPFVFIPGPAYLEPVAHGHPVAGLVVEKLVGHRACK